MSNHPVEPGEGADDLLGRWLAHHEQPSDEDVAPAPRRIPTAARPSEAAAARATRPSASAALAGIHETAGDAPTVNRRDGLGSVAPPSTFGVRRGLTEVAELDRPSPVGFEPVIIASVRKKSEPKEELEKGKRGRLARLRARVSTPAEPEPSASEPAGSLYDEPVGVVPPPIFKTPTPSVGLPPPPVFFAPRVVEPVATPVATPVAEPVATPVATPVAAPVAAPVSAPVVQPAANPPTQARKIVAYQDMLALATAAALPDTEDEATEQAEVRAEVEAAPAPIRVVLEPEPEPAPEPEPEPEPAPAPAPAPTPVALPPEPAPTPVALPTEPAPTPVALPTEPAPAPEPVATPAVAAREVVAPTKRRLVTRSKHTEPHEPDEPDVRRRRSLFARATAPGTGTGDAARGLLAAARATAPVVQAPSRPDPAPAMEPVPMLAAATTMVEAPGPVAEPMQMPNVYEFAPLKSSRRFLTLMLLAGLILSGAVGFRAYQSRDTIEMGIAAIVIFATLVIWAIRAGATVTRLTIRSGQLEIVRQGGRVVFDLASTYTPIEVVGRPGSKKWRVAFLRRGMAPVVIDSTMVDGRDFMRVLGFYRPEYAK
jgi:hypothetical protein